MKYLITAIVVLTTTLVQAEGETKKVCHDEQQNGRTIEVCKTIKVHKKLEGTTVPVKK